MQFLGVVIKVLYLQKKRDLLHLADDYILGSDTNIQVIVGLDIEYGAGKEKMATWSVWEPETVRDDDDGEDVLIVKMTVDGEVFSHHYPIHCTDKLTLLSRSFAPRLAHHPPPFPTMPYKSPSTLRALILLPVQRPTDRQHRHSSSDTLQIPSRRRANGLYDGTEDWACQTCRD